MVAIPGGEYLIGRNSGDFLDPYEKPQHTVTLRPFYIDRTEVTNADYQKFIEATGHPAPASWVGGRFEDGKELFPVTGVTLSDAEAYARWAGKRLPTEEEWEAAAHGRTPTVFPWGDTFDPSRANVKASGLGVPVRVGTYPAGASPFGVLDMTGNVWEWTASEAQLYPGSNEKPPSWDKPLNPGTRLQIIRGGAFTEDTKRCTVTYRNWVPSDFKSRELGFRCAQDQPPQ
jgi:formylglycine-generating enzyme required for sulfatase activity